jgi:hypothetical protein
MRDDPVLLVGMHHSGTSIFAEVLHRHGVFMGADMGHYESKFITQRINDELIMGGGPNWSHIPILSVEYVMSKLDAARAEIERGLRKAYMRAAYDGQEPWGFKDPRTCVTLPLFLEIFPHARLIHIVRREADVAESLARREKAGVGVLRDPRHWRELRLQHVARVRRFGALHGLYREFAYEEFCLRPIEVTQPIFEWLGLPFTTRLEGFLRSHIYTDRIGIRG